MRPDLRGEGREAGDVVEAASAAPQPDSPTAPRRCAVHHRPSARSKTPTRCRAACPFPSCVRRSNLCKPTGVTLDEGSRVVVMLDQGGVGKSLVNRLEKRGVTVLALEPGIDTDMLKAQFGDLAGRRVDPGRLLAARAGRGAGHRRDEPGRVARTEPGARQESLHDHACALRRRLAGRHLPDLGDAAGRPARLRRRSAPLRRWAARSAASPRPTTSRQGMRDGAGRAGQGGRLRGQPQDRGTGRSAHRRDALRPRRRRGRLPRRPTLHRHAGREAGGGWPARHGRWTKSTVFVVTGAAGGITSAIVTDLAVASKGIFYLLDLVRCPGIATTPTSCSSAAMSRRSSAS